MSTRLSFDFSDRPREYYEPILGKLWMACFSGTHLDPVGVDDLTRRALRAGPEIVLVTAGAQGASISTATGETVRVGASPGTPLDTLGAGDAVIGTVLAGLLRADDLETVMSSAMSVATKVCRAVRRFRARTSCCPTGRAPCQTGTGGPSCRPRPGDDLIEGGISDHDPDISTISSPRRSQVNGTTKSQPGTLSRVTGCVVRKLTRTPSSLSSAIDSSPGWLPRDQL